MFYLYILIGFLNFLPTTSLSEAGTMNDENNSLIYSEYFIGMDDMENSPGINNYQIFSVQTFKKEDNKFKKKIQKLYSDLKGCFKDYTLGSHHIIHFLKQNSTNLYLLTHFNFSLWNYYRL
jgi:hypothetical protein